MATIRRELNRCSTSVGHEGINLASYIAPNKANKIGVNKCLPFAHITHSPRRLSSSTISAIMSLPCKQLVDLKGISGLNYKRTILVSLQIFSHPLHTRPSP